MERLEVKYSVPKSAFWATGCFLITCLFAWACYTVGSGMLSEGSFDFGSVFTLLICCLMGSLGVFGTIFLARSCFDRGPVYYLDEAGILLNDFNAGFYEWASFDDAYFADRSTIHLVLKDAVSETNVTKRILQGSTLVLDFTGKATSAETVMAFVQNKLARMHGARSEVKSMETKK